MRNITILGALPLLVLLVLWGCDNDTSNDVTGPGDGGGQTDKTCLGCHESEDALKAALGDSAGLKVSVWDKDDG